MEKPPEKPKGSLEFRHKQEAIRRLENVEGVTDQAKAQLLLTYANLKPACYIRWNKEISKETGSHDSSAPEDLLTICDQLGLRYSSSDGFRNLAIGRNWESVQQLSELVQKHKDTIDQAELAGYHQSFGTLVGYPPTAVDAFVRRRISGTPREEVFADLPEEVLGTPLGKFSEEIGMRLSKAHWKEELKVVEQWMDAIKELSPALYERMQADPLPGGAH